MHRMPPSLILCDVGDTLVHLVSYDRTAGLNAIRPLADAPERMDPGLLLEEGPQLDSWFEDRVAPSSLEYRQATFLRLLAGRHGVAFECDDDHLEWLYWRSALRFEPEPGLEAALERILGCGVELGVISNTVVGPYAMERELDRQGLGDLFLHPVVTSAGCGVRKPERAIFDLALGLLGADRATTWYVGNSLAHDVVGAHAAELTAVHYLPGAHGGSRAEVVPDIAMDSWDSLADLVEHLTDGGASDDGHRHDHGDEEPHTHD